MATADAQLVFKYKGDTSQAQKSVGKLGATLKKAGGIMAAAFAIKKIYSIGAAFEKSFAKVLTLVDRTSVSVDGLKKNIINLSNETGVAATELNEGLYQALSAGVTITNDGADALAFLTTNLKLAKAGFTDTNTAVDATTTVINAYGLEQSKVMEISNMLLATQNEGKTTIAELGGQLSSVIPIAANLGVGFDQVSAAIATLTAGGKSTAEATTELRALFTELAKTTSKAGQAFERINGKSFPEFVREGGNVSDGLVEMQKYANDNNIEMLSLFGNTRSASGALSLASETGAAKFNKALNTMENSAGLTDAAFKEMTNTAEYKMEKAINKLTNTGIKLFGALAPVIELVAGALGLVASALAFVVDGFTGANRVATVMIGVLAALAVVWGIINAKLLYTSIILPIISVAETIYIKLLYAKAAAMVVAGKAAEIMGHGMTMALGVIGVIIAAILALVAVIAIFVSNPLAQEAKRIKKELKEMNDELEKTQSELEANMDVSNKLGEELVSLAKDVKSNEDVTNKMRIKVRLLNKSLGEEAVTIDDVTGKLHLYGKEISDNGTELIQMIALKKKDAEVTALQTVLSEALQKQAEARRNLDLAEEDLTKSNILSRGQANAAMYKANEAYNEATEAVSAYDAQLTELGAAQAEEVEAIEVIALEMAKGQTEKDKLDAIDLQRLADKELNYAEHGAALEDMMESNYIEMGLTEEEYIATMAEHQQAIEELEAESQAEREKQLEEYNQAVEDATNEHIDTLFGLNEDGLYNEAKTVDDLNDIWLKNQEDMANYYSNLETLSDLGFDDLVTSFEKGGVEIGGSLQNTMDGLQGIGIDSWKLIRDDWEKNGGKLSEGMKSKFSDIDIEAGLGVLALQDTATTGFGDAADYGEAEFEPLVDAAGNIMENVDDVIETSGEAIGETAGDVGDKVVSGVVDSAKAGQSELVAAGISVGNNYVAGVIIGLEKMRKFLIIQAKSLAYSMNNAFNKAQISHSPSKVGEKSGGYYPAGVALGVEKGTPDVVQKVVDMANAMARAGTMGAQATSNQNVVYNNQRTVNATYQPEVPAGTQADLQFLDFSRGLKEGFAI